MATLNDIQNAITPLLDMAIRKRMKQCGVPDEVIEKAMSYEGDDKAETIHALCQVYAAENLKEMRGPIYSHGVQIAVRIRSV